MISQIHNKKVLNALTLMSLDKKIPNSEAVSIIHCVRMSVLVSPPLSTGNCIVNILLDLLFFQFTPEISSFHPY